MKNLIITLILLTLTIFVQAQNWEILDTGTTSRIYDMSFPAGQNDIGYAATGSGLYSGVGTVIKTEDGGDTWTQVYPVSGTADILKSIFFTSVDTGYAGGMNDSFIKTTDGGATWANITISSVADIFHTITFFDDNNGITVANPVATSSSTIYVTDNAGESWTVATGLTHGVNDLTYSNETTVFAVGHQNQSISRSTDGGLSWSLVNTGNPTFFLLGVDFVDDYGVAVGQFGDIYITSNGGDSWTYNNSISTSDNYQGIHVFNADSTYFGGMNEKMYKTTDGGSTWVVEYDGPGSNHFYDIEFTGNGTGFAGLSNGNILRKTPPASGDPELIVTPSTYVFDDTYIGETTSFDFTFSNTGTDPLNISDITFTNSAFSINNTSFTIQPGQTDDIPVYFTPPASGLFEGIMQIWSNDPINNPYEVELSGNGIAELIDGWEWIDTGFNFILMDIQFPEGQNQIGYCVGQNTTYNGDGIVIKTTDGGSTWTQLTSDVIPGLTGMSFVDINTGYAIGWNDYVIKTTDGGITWNTLNVATGMWSFYYDIEFFDANNGIVLAGQDVYVTDDGGDTWSSANAIGASCNMITYINEDNLITVGYENHIYKSTDGGYNWTIKNQGSVDQVLLGVDFLNESYGMAAGDYGYIFTTTDGGETWTEDTQVGSNELLHTPFIWDEDTAWVCGTPERVFKTTDGGNTWNSAYAGNWQRAFYRIMFTDNYTGFICGSGGVVLRKEPLPAISGYIEGTVSIANGTGNVEDVVVEAGGVTTNPLADGTYSIELYPGIYDVTATLDGYGTEIIEYVVVTEGNTTTGIDFNMFTGGDDIIIAATELGNNYPNPFNPETTISYQLHENGKVELTVYNLKGQKVKQLVSDQLSAGKHSVVWNGKDDTGKPVSSGVYFYKMKVGKYVEAKKMILMK